MRGGLWDRKVHELQLRRLQSEKLADESGNSRQPIPRRNTTKGRKVMVEQFRKYIDDPQSLLRDWRLAQTRAMREAVAGQLAEDAPGWPVEQILHDDVSEPEHRPVDRAGQTRRLLFGRAALHVAARIESRLLARQFLLALIALVATLLLGSLALIASKGGWSLLGDLQQPVSASL